MHRKIELDFVRGIAILLVMGFHYSFPATGSPLDSIAGTWKAVGWIGVDLFFVLSGFLVGGLLMKEYKATGAIIPRRFLVRRAFKIWPPLYVLVLFHVALGRHPLEAFFWQNLLHVQNYFGTSIAQTWSLAVEEHFYLLLAFVLWASVSRGPRFVAWTLVGIASASVVARLLALGYGVPESAFGQTQYRMDGLMCGVLLALVFHFRPQLFAKLAAQRALLFAAVVGLCAWVLLTAGNQVLTRSIGYTVLALGFVALLVLVHEHSGRLVTQRWYRAVAWVGLYSYGIYLWHTVAAEPGRRLIAMLAAHSVPPVAAWFVAGAVQFAIGIAVGYVMTKLVEWPALRLRDRLFPADASKKPAPVAAAA